MRRKGTLLWKTQVDTHPLGAHRGRADAVSATGCMSRSPRAKRRWRPIPAMAAAPFAAASRRSISASGRIALEKLHRARGAAADPQEQRRRPGIRTRRRADLVVAHHRSEAWRAVRAARAAQPPGSTQSLTDAVVAFDLERRQIALGQATRARPASRVRAALPVRRSCAPWAAAIKSFWPDNAPAWSTDSIPITAARFSGKPAARPRAKRAGGIAWGLAADHHSLYVALSGAGADPAMRPAA